jgi:prevent-host-death family protein
MSRVTIRDLRNHGGAVVDRVLAGESLVITRSGKPVAQLRPVPRPSVRAEVLLARWRTLPVVDPEKLRRDLDEMLDPRL